MSTNPVPAADVRAALERVCAGKVFRGAERSKALLNFVVRETLEGRTDRLKDYTLGAEALGRGDAFDPRTDPIARVEASRLRSRLEHYYATEGAGDPVRISLPRGGYVPEFSWGPSSALSSAPDVPAARGLNLPILHTALAAAIFLAGGAAGWMLSRSAAHDAPDPVRLELTTPPTTDPVSLAVSPDGRAILFVASHDHRPHLWLRRLDSDTAQRLEGTADASLPFWAPDGRAVGFFADGQIKRIDLTTQATTAVVAAPVPAGAAWNRDGVILYPLAPDSGLFQATAASPPQPATVTTSGPGGHRGPVFLADGRRFLFYAANPSDARGIYVGGLGTTTTRRLVDADAPAVLPVPDHIVYVQRSRLFAHRIDPATATLVGRPLAIADGIAVESLSGLGAVAAAGGTIAYRRGLSGGKRQFVWVNRQGHVLSQIGTPAAGGPSYPSLSPDGRRLAVQRTLDGNTDIAVVDVDRGTSIRLTSAPGPDIAPHWSPRGDRILYSSVEADMFQLFEQKLDDDEPARPVLRTPQSKQVTDWSRDGRYVLFRAITMSPRLDMDIWAFPLDGDRTPFPVANTPFEERDAQFSPDGQWVAYHANDSGQHEVYAQPFRGAGERVRISTGGGVQARWRADGRELFYVALDGRLMAVPIGRSDDGRLLRPGTPTALFPAGLGPLRSVARHSYIASPDGQRFLLERVIEEAAAPISVIVNWKPS